MAIQFNNSPRIQRTLVENARYTLKEKVLSADNIGSHDFEQWKTLVHETLPVAFDLSVSISNCESASMKKEKRSALYVKVRELFAAFGNIEIYDQYGNSHEVMLTIDSDLLDAVAFRMCGDSSKWKKEDKWELKNAKKMLTAEKAVVREAMQQSGVNPEYIKEHEQNILRYQNSVEELSNTPDMSVWALNPQYETTYRKNFEKFLATILTQQKTRTWEEYQEIKKEMRKKHNQRSNKSKHNKALAEAKADLKQANADAIANR